MGPEPTVTGSPHSATLQAFHGFRWRTAETIPGQMPDHVNPGGLIVTNMHNHYRTVGYRVLTHPTDFKIGVTWWWLLNSALTHPLSKSANKNLENNSFQFHEERPFQYQIGRLPYFGGMGIALVKIKQLRLESELSANRHNYQECCKVLLIPF